MSEAQERVQEQQSASTPPMTTSRKDGASPLSYSTRHGARLPRLAVPPVVVVVMVLVGVLLGTAVATLLELL